MIRQAFFAVGISLACLLPPLIHFVTGPLGPLIGGWFAGSKTQASQSQSVILGLLMGMIVSFILALLLAVAMIIPALMPEIEFATIIIVILSVISYTITLGSIGAFLGGYMVRRSTASPKGASETKIRDHA